MFEVANDQTSGPRITQLSVFLSNRLGALLKVTRVLEKKKIRICGLSILDSAEHAVVRLIVDKPDLALTTLSRDSIPVFESEILGVALNPEVGIRRILSVLLLAEVNVHYTYALMDIRTREGALAISVEDMDLAARVLIDKGLELVGQGELETES